MKNSFFGISFCLFIFTAGFVAAYSYGPPDAATGAPNQGTCAFTICHSSFPINSGNGSLTISGPATYQPNSLLIFSIDISQSGQSRWGFETTMLDTNNNFVGFFINDDPTRIQISLNEGIEFVKHTTNGTDAGVIDIAPGWNINWQAPSTNVGPVTIYVASNAANSDGDASGDYIYLQSFTLTPDFSPCCIANRGNVDNDPLDDVDISDLVYIVDFIFTNGPDPVCFEEANIDGNVEGDVDISDLVYIVDFIFTNGPPPPACP